MVIDSHQEICYENAARTMIWQSHAFAIEKSYKEEKAIFWLFLIFKKNQVR